MENKTSILPLTQEQQLQDRFDLANETIVKSNNRSVYKFSAMPFIEGDMNNNPNNIRIIINFKIGDMYVLGYDQFLIGLRNMLFDLAEEKFQVFRFEFTANDDTVTSKHLIVFPRENPKLMENFFTPKLSKELWDAAVIHGYDVVSFYPRLRNLTDNWPDYENFIVPLKQIKCEHCPARSLNS